MPILILQNTKFYNVGILHTVVGDYINTMKATLDLNFDLEQAVKHI